MADQDMITYVAVGKDVKDCKSILSWAIENNVRGSRICIIHVHKPAKLFPLVRSLMTERKVRERLESGTQSMHAIMEEYFVFCQQKGVQAQTQTIEMNSIREGIVKLISKYGIRKLVIGSTSANHYKRKVEVGSKKAKYVCKTAPLSCQVQVICKGHLIFTREASATDTETGQSNLNRSRSGPSGYNNRVGSPLIECSDFPKLRSVTVGRNRSTPLAALIASFPERSKELSSPASPGDSSYSARSPTRPVEITLNGWNDRSSSTLDLAPSVVQQSPRLISSSSNISTSSNGAHNVVQERSLEEQLQQAMAALKKEALVRQRAEGYMIDAIRRAQDAENQRDNYIEELWISKEQETSLKSQLAELQKERDELQMERDHALKEAEGLKKKEEDSNGHMLELPEFSLSKIAEVTQGFHESQKIGQGGYGNIYIGRLQTEVAIKMLHSHGSQGSQEFQMEVNVLGQLRHPNLVKLIGSCPEAFALIYEYLPNGSLEDRLKCKDNSPPLSWQTRLRIAIELCSVLVYLHSSTRPRTIVHGDLKPANILLDSNYVCKLSDFGICRVLSRDRSSSDSVTLSHNTVPKGTLPYLDPEFLQRGVLTVKSDVYSFGIILLQLLTGKSPPYSIVDEVNSALLAGNFESLLDPSAGRWPLEVAQSLAELALMCSDNYRKRRPDLGTRVLELLESLRDPT
ncbi:U-box domain-containing protein 33-like isoform X3 [Juglans microcarpa x Juglans regia]|uniref:U-box domain-containing protein 33-like isoform X3 n=1 Tax=Juglans microcarpa x Juglans regia TaxID=2249226 RepID=UPI001B7EDBB2|nr:U-box domain-containing protein 33-like isoform X3 [Juglans microcarpa x Juglans regia]